MKYFFDAQRELTALCELAARLGRNPLLVQASSGNVSVKLDDDLWIKASGKWLIIAESEEILVRVRLARAKECLRDSLQIPEARVKNQELRASIETAMHAVLPQRVVIHVHSVNVIAWAVRKDGALQLGRKLDGLRWRWISYTPSGDALAKKIQRILSRAVQTDVLVLGNHGLVVCGDSVASAENLLAEVEERVSIRPRAVAASDPDQIACTCVDSDWLVPRWTEVHALADSISQQILSGGALYPCQAIFLPGTVPTLSQDGSCEPPDQRRQSMLRLLEHCGVLCSKNMTPAEQQMLLGLANVVRRVDASAPIRYLTASEIRDVLQGDTAGYREVCNENGYQKTEATSL